ncbi:hypothetical protein VP01_8873g1, partial [Puccinia sorghi]
SYKGKGNQEEFQPSDTNHKNKKQKTSNPDQKLSQITPQRGIKLRQVKNDDKGVEMEEKKLNKSVALEEKKCDHRIKLDERKLDTEKRRRNKKTRFLRWPMFFEWQNHSGKFVQVVCLKIYEKNFNSN